MQSVALIVAYFGKLPPFYKAWEASAIANNTIDFYVFTDDNSIVSKENIIIKHITFSEFKSLIQEKFEFQISLNSPYKLCDYKPTYGYVFQDVLKDYDWWGYCDIDLVLGDIRKFFHESILKNYERCQKLGHICIYKNSEKMNTLFKFSENAYPAINYDMVYKTDESMYFDEARGMSTKCIINHVKNYCEQSFRDPLEGKRKFLHSKSKKGNNYVVFWDDGKLYCVEKNGCKTELLYAHFFRRKFEIGECSDKIKNIKILPKRVEFNCEVVNSDFYASESIFYKYMYKIKNAYKSVKRYGLKRTLERQKWSKDHDIYITTLK